jgi:polar amino acid transport system substrate-binding protein
VSVITRVMSHMSLGRRLAGGSLGTPRTSSRRLALLLTMFAGALAGCGSSGSSGSSHIASTAQVAPPAAIAAKGHLVVCSDEVEPPFAYREGAQLTGSEVEIMDAVAKLMGVQTEYSQIGFDGLFAALAAGKCDVAIDEVSDTPEREHTIADVDYMKVGQTFMVKAGNPLQLKTFADLCGHAVGAVLASVDVEYLHVLSKQCTGEGKPAITIVGFNDDPTGTEALITGKIDAFQEDTPLLTGLIARSGGAVALSPQAQVKRIPCGIAVARNNTALANAIKKALNLLYADGTMTRIFSKFHEGGVALSGSDPVMVDAASHGA